MPVKPIERNGKFLFDYPDAHGRRRWGTAPDADAAILIQSQRKKEWALIKAGLINPEQLQQARAVAVPIEKQLLEYQEHLKAKQVSRQHLQNTLGALRRVVKWLDVGSAQEIAIGKVETLFNRKMEEGMGPRMRNFYCKALKAFLQLLEDREQILKNPLRKLKSINEETDQKNVSRPMTHAEFDALLRPLEIPTAVEGGASVPLTAQQLRRAERRLFYLFVARTGMRWREAGRLLWRHVDAVAWWLDVKAHQTKTKKAASLPVPTDLVAAIEQWKAIAAAAEDSPIFPHGVPTARTWKADLVAAGIVALPAGTKFRQKRRRGRKAVAGYRDLYAKTANLAGYADADGCKLHRKCLRLTFGTWLYEAGVDIREAQRLMRHADINLTSKIYTRLRMTDLQRAAAKVTDAMKPAAAPPADQKKLA